ncbi:hypothetical protein KAI46_13735 [bacterium]|nr:hypothetical protein [bacterium]
MVTSFDNGLFRFQSITIDYKKIPEGWLVKISATKSNFDLAIVPDKEHFWKPREETLQTIKFMGMTGTRFIKTPQGWLVCMTKKDRLSSYNGDTTDIRFVNVKYIHDPENKFNPEE